ncbi:hypothetical protein JTE90_006311 [Oedothorax gibbosus]|uniref:Uncharacterized protein n=1 Tax=Oedothorax gibbosus TaxID=931172 RepID=A0AAV6U2X1_9ARAC|nr:hypothetical protein JTE90_006311 [Oedothorax gibbosus]
MGKQGQMLFSHQMLKLDLLLSNKCSTKTQGRRERTNSQKFVDNDGFQLINSNKAAEAQSFAAPRTWTSTSNSFEPVAPNSDFVDTQNKAPRVPPVIFKTTMHFKSICQAIKQAVPTVVSTPG